MFDNIEFNEIFPIEQAGEVFLKSDIIILTLPLTKKTEHFINKDRLSKMKQGTILVNISRGKIVNELDLVEALQTNLGGAVLDVFEEEPLEANNPLWECNNVIITPHISFIGNNMQRLKALILSNIESFV